MAVYPSNVRIYFIHDNLQNLYLFEFQNLSPLIKFDNVMKMYTTQPTK